MDYKGITSLFIMGLKKEYQDLPENEKIVPKKIVEKFLDKRKDLDEEEYIELKDEIIETLGNNSDIFWSYSQSEISKEDFETMIEELEDAGYKTQFPL
jgi:hypothetical protein